MNVESLSIAGHLPAPWILLDPPRARARAIVERYGVSAQDFFKTWPDKSIFLTANRASFVAYRVSARLALALGDPVGPPREAVGAIREFLDFCRERWWTPAFHQVRPEYLPLYRDLGFRSMKAGEDAIVDVRSFSLQGRAMKEFRNTVNRLEKLGYRVGSFEPPMPARALREAREISDEWLRLPGRRERRFTLGRFDPEYVRSTPVHIAYDPSGSAAAFLNLPPSYTPGAAAIDLMRRRDSAPNGIIDYLFAKTFLELKTRGFDHVNLGMAPLSGFRDGEETHWEERVVYRILTRFDHVFSFQGLRAFKAKYATRWEPRYTVYPSVPSLARVGLALRRVTEIDD